MADPLHRVDRQSFPRTASCLPQIFEFMERFFDGAAIAETHRKPMEFAVEEWFTNLVKYSRGGSRDILLELRREGERLAVSLTDYGVERFDIRTMPDANVDLDLRDRKPGGLGIHLLRRMVDDIAYEYVDGRSTTTFVRSLG
jgi:serine/threonine-protein kinase RsbW